MTSRVLVPVDVSEQSKDALRWAAREFPEGEITALHVVDPGLPGHMPGVEVGLDPDDERYPVEVAERYLERVVGDLDVEDVDLDTAVRESRSISNGIVEHADEGGFDHVVVGSHGRTGASRVLLGSVAEKVVRRSPTPVTVVR